jgi:hypothetical protein
MKVAERSELTPSWTDLEVSAASGGAPDSDAASAIRANAIRARLSQAGAENSDAASAIRASAIRARLSRAGA